MRDDNMSVAEVARQIEAVALAVKTGSSVSDLRHHRFTHKLHRAQACQVPDTCVHMLLHCKPRSISALRVF